MKHKPTLFILALVCLAAIVLYAADPTFQSFNISQFFTSVPANQIAIKSGVKLTNAVEYGTLQLPGIPGGAGYFAALNSNGTVTAAIPAGGGGNATNAIANTNGSGTNTLLTRATNAATMLPLADTSLTNGLAPVNGGLTTNDATYGWPLEQSTNLGFDAMLPFHGTTVNESKLHWFYKAMSPTYNNSYTAITNTNAVKIMFIGDSWGTQDSGQMMSGIYSGISEYMNWGGSLSGGGGLAGYGVYPSATGTANNAYPDTNWGYQYWMLSGAGVITNAVATCPTCQFFPQTNADTITVGFLVGPTLGTFDIYQIAAVGGPTLKVGTVNSYAANWAGKVTNITLSPPTNVYCYVSNVAGSNDILFLGAMATNQHNFIFYGFAWGARDPGNWYSVQTNVFIPVMQALNPSLIVFENRNSQVQWMQTNYGNFIDFFSNAMPQADQIHIGSCLVFSNDVTGITNQLQYNQGIIAANQAMRYWSLNKGRMYFDAQNQMPDTNTMKSIGWSPDGVHLYSKDLRVGGEIWNEMQAQLGGVDLMDFTYFKGNVYQEVKALSGGISTNITTNVPAVNTNLFNSQLMLYLPLDEGVGNQMGDVSGHYFAGNDYLAAGTNWVVGKFGYAWQNISNTGNNITIPLSGNTPWITNGITLSCWFNSTNSPYNNTTTLWPFIKENAFPDGAFDWQWTGLTGDDTNCYVHMMINTNGIMGYLVQPVTTPHICDGKWHFLALSYNNSNLYVMVDTNLCLSKSTGTNAYITNALQNIAIANGNVQFIEDDVRIYSPALTTNDLLYLYQSGTPSYASINALTAASFTGNAAGLTNLPLAALQTNGSVDGWVITRSNGIPVWSNAPSGGGVTPTFSSQFNSGGGVTNLGSLGYAFGITNPAISSSVANGSIETLYSPYSFGAIYTSNATEIDPIYEAGGGGLVSEEFSFGGLGYFWERNVTSNLYKVLDLNLNPAITVSNITDTVNFRGNMNVSSNLSAGGISTGSGTMSGNGSGLTNLQYTTIYGAVWLNTASSPTTYNITGPARLYITNSSTVLLVANGTTNTLIGTGTVSFPEKVEVDQIGTNYISSY